MPDKVLSRDPLSRSKDADIRYKKCQSTPLQKSSLFDAPARRSYKPFLTVSNESAFCTNLVDSIEGSVRFAVISRILSALRFISVRRTFGLQELVQGARKRTEVQANSPNYQFLRLRPFLRFLS